MPTSACRASSRTNIFRVEHRVPIEERWKANGHKGGVLWMTGPVRRRQVDAGLLAWSSTCSARATSSTSSTATTSATACAPTSGFSPQDRVENIRRVGHAAGLFARAGFLVHHRLHLALSRRPRSGAGDGAGRLPRDPHRRRPQHLRDARPEGAVQEGAAAARSRSSPAFPRPTSRRRQPNCDRSTPLEDACDRGRVSATAATTHVIAKLRADQRALRRYATTVDGLEAGHHPVILSGGAGTRLWPLSRSLRPKQLLPLVSERSMLQETVLRVDWRRASRRR